MPKGAHIQLTEPGKVLLARKQYLFQELTRIFDIVKNSNFSDDIEADIQLSVLDRHETTFGELIKDILTLNATAEKGEEISTNDFDTFRSQIDSIRKCCLKCKLRVAKRTTEQHSEGVKLWKIDMPVFSGNVGEWQTFIEQYNATVHSKVKLSGVEKLTYLRSVLRNEPLSIVSQYTLKEESYPLAYSALVDRYSNPRLLSRHYINQIVSYKPSPAQFGKQFMRFMEIHRAAIFSLFKLEIPDLANYILFELAYRNLPPHQQKLFDREVKPHQLPNLDQFFTFVDTLARSEELHADLNTTTATNRTNFKTKNQNVLLGVSNENIQCSFCKQGHHLFRCKNFAILPLAQKLKIVKKCGACEQCLGNHKNACSSKYSCRNCQSKNHHSFLCNLPPNSETSQGAPSMQKSVKEMEGTGATLPRTCNACLASRQSTVLLGTIKAYVADRWGTLHEIRAVCDSGSQVNIVTQSLVKKLGLQRMHSPVDIQSVAQYTSKVLGSVNIEMRSSENKDIAYEFGAVILPKICGDLPSELITNELPEPLHNLTLADPEYRETKKIDILLGADAYMDILSDKNPSVIKNNPTAIRTIFGYILTGRVDITEAPRKITLCTTSLDSVLKSFWEVENIENPIKSLDDLSCEQHFRSTFKRDPTGRYVVRLPFQEDATPLQTNMTHGVKSLCRLENRFQSVPGLQESYSEIMEDYLKQGHMSLAQDNVDYVLPHHCVYKDSTSTAIRVVFDASSPDITGASLNSRLKAGPKLQNELPQLLISFRFHEVALQADIRQMFRNIKLNPDDRKYQQFLWRFSPAEEIKQYQLNTVTFGFTSSPYLAQRVLKQLVEDEGKAYPEASEAVLHHTFMDDFVTGAPTIEDAKKLRRDLSTLLAKGGFELRKWSSSHPTVLDELSNELVETPFEFPSGEKGVKILGILWDQTTDSFRYKVTEFQTNIVTKRSVLSYIARIWDCLGLVAPVVLKGKYFLQRLWLEKQDWDETLQPDLVDSWLKFTKELPKLEELRIPRKLPFRPKHIRIVGFSDASEIAMSANVYVHVTYNEEWTETQLVMSKTKLAPLRTWTIPRLELSAALLLTKVVDYVRSPMLMDAPIHLFTDSQIVLSWLRIPPHNLKIFVANRVIQIMENLPEGIWNHVAGNENPADLSSRGLNPSEILHNKLWWNGPDFLKLHPSRWPNFHTEVLSIENCPEVKSTNKGQILTVQTLSNNPINEYIDKVSSLSKLQRVMGFILRYMYNLRYKKSRRFGVLTATELNNALLTCVKLTQHKYFSTEINALQRGIEVLKPLQSFSPFLDERQLLRAGGRIRRAESLVQDARHPLILPKNCSLSALICDFYHLKLLHAGPKTMQTAIQQKFWILSVRQLIKKRLRLCLRCYKLSAAPKQPLMGELPYHRVNPSRPFTNVCIDFGGPFTTKESRLKSSVKHKSYMCIFVCMAVKAVHIEGVSELSTPAFLAALNRFTSRRGLPQNIYSDCGRNFVGAAKELKINFQNLMEDKSKILEFAAGEGITWHFSPPYGPNFNGLAEAAIKSAKRHLLRQIGEEILTFEELVTLLCRIEAVLNSRPLTVMNNEPNENLLYLSPAHFLIGDRMLSVPEAPEEEISLKERWHRVQGKSQTFWKQWSREYLHTLLQRHRWNRNGTKLAVGQVVFLTGENLPPLQWPIGRIVALHPGEDKVDRVATVKVKGKEFKRPVSKLLTLPEEH